jgi:hypothetical protein
MFMTEKSRGYDLSTVKSYQFFGGIRTLNLPALCPMPDRVDDNALPLHSIQDDVRSASDHELPDPRLDPGAAQVGMIS